MYLTNAGNSYGGGTYLNGGLLEFSALGCLGTGNIVSFGGGGLQWVPGNTADISTRTVTLGPGGGTFDTGSNTVTIGHPISGTGGLTKAGNGTLKMNDPHALGDDGGGLSVTGGTLDLNGCSPHVGALGGTGGIIVNSAAGSATLYSNFAGTSTYGGSISAPRGS